MEHINQLRKWQEQMDKAETGSAADMDVAARLLRHGIEATEALTAITKWLETNQPDVFRRGLWDAILKVGASNTAVLRHNVKSEGAEPLLAKLPLD